MEIGVDGLDEKTADIETIAAELADAGPDRIWYVADAFRCGMAFDEIHEHTHIDPWFLVQIEDLVRQEQSFAGKSLDTFDLPALRQLKRKRFLRSALGEADECYTGGGPLRRHHSACARCTSGLILAPLSSLRVLRICIPLTKRNVKRCRATGKR